MLEGSFDNLVHYGHRGGRTLTWPGGGKQSAILGTGRRNSVMRNAANAPKLATQMWTLTSWRASRCVRGVTTNDAAANQSRRRRRRRRRRHRRSPSACLTNDLVAICGIGWIRRKRCAAQCRVDGRSVSEAQRSASIRRSNGMGGVTPFNFLNCRLFRPWDCCL